MGDFGLARSQQIGANAEETRVIGTLGYLAPEYAESGSITEKADVYSFGVILLELIIGRKAIDTTKARGDVLHRMGNFLEIRICCGPHAQESSDGYEFESTNGEIFPGQ